MRNVSRRATATGHLEPARHVLAPRVKHLHTLGPTGTNLEAAAHEWLGRQGINGDVTLHRTLEEGLETIPVNGEHALVACAVYPELHTLVFSNLLRLRMIDSFVLPTHRMVLATAGSRRPATVCSHPAPSGLAPPYAQLRMVTSNAQAALDCAAGLDQGCITTEVAATASKLRIVQDFGAVPMIFTIHHVATQEAT